MNSLTSFRPFRSLRGIALAAVLVAAIPAVGAAGFDLAFEEFAALDQKAPPPSGGILFVGSSIFRNWTNVAEQMAPLQALNRAFGGSRTQDQLEHFEQLVPRYRPRIVVYYCGSNDLNSAAPDAPPEIFGRFRAFVDRTREFDPAIRIVFVASFRSPDRVARWEQVDHFNALARSYCSTDANLSFVDLNPVIVDASGNPRLELFQEDKLHYRAEAYSEFAAKLRPVLERIWAEVSSASRERSELPQN